MSDEHRRSILRSLLRHSEEVAYPAAMEEASAYDIVPEAIGHIWILSEGILPGYVSSVSEGCPAHSREDLLGKLRQEDPFSSPLISTWFMSERLSCPKIASYLVHLDHIRRKAIDILESAMASE